MATKKKKKPWKTFPMPGAAVPGSKQWNEHHHPKPKKGK